MRIDQDKEPLKFIFPVEVGDHLMRLPEAKMWCYCLMQGIATAIGSYRTRDLRKTGKQDRYWFLRDNRHYVGSCSWICELLGVDRERLIRHVFKNRHLLRRHPCKLRISYNDG
jgi:hypothetical protein